MRKAVSTTGRIFAATLGALFLASAAWILWQRAPEDWLQLLGAALVGLLGLDFIASAIRGRWPLVAGALSLP